MRAAARVGNAKVTILTPSGVPATVVLTRGSATAVFAKPATGTKKSRYLRVAPGTWRVNAKPIAYKNTFYVPTASSSKVVVRSGRTTKVTVTWKAVRVATKPQITALKQTAVGISFTKPSSSSQVRVRVVAGVRPPTAVTSGRAATVSGTRATISGLNPGRPYTIGVFTKVGRKWLGSVSLQVTTQPSSSTTAPAAAYVANPGAILVTPGTSLSSRVVSTRHVATKLPAGSVAVLGAPVVLPVSKSLPGGFVGKISGVSSTGSTVTLVQIPLGEAFD